ncbi:Hok/Gef family protein [Escherichia coli]
MIWQPEFTDKTLSRKTGAVQFAVCATVLCFSLIFRERLCELNIHRGNTVVQITLAYEARK